MSVELMRVGIAQVIKTAGQTGVTHGQISEEMARNMAWLIKAAWSKRENQLLAVRQVMTVIAEELEKPNAQQRP